MADSSSVLQWVSAVGATVPVFGGMYLWFDRRHTSIGEKIETVKKDAEARLEAHIKASNDSREILRRELSQEIANVDSRLTATAALMATKEDMNSLRHEVQQGFSSVTSRLDRVIERGLPK